MSTLPTVSVLGAGLMGHGIAQVFMLAGASVRIWDPDPEVLHAVPERIGAHLALLDDASPITVQLCSTLEDAVADAAIVIEAAPENIELKQNLVQQVQALNETCIFASNTSVLRITEIAAHAARPEQVIGTHWWNPPYLIPLVEVVRGESTSDTSVSQTLELLRAVGKTPVEVFHDAPGFVGNRMQFALMREAINIAEEGICAPEDVDLVARLTFGRRMPAIGPLRNADFIGLDLVASILDYLSPSLSQATETPQLIKDLLRTGAHGSKTGQGIYSWAEGERNEQEQQLLSYLATQNEEL